MAGALPAAALPARPSSTPRSYGICISMGRAQPAHLLGLRSVLEGPSLMLLPIDTLVHEIKKKINVSPEKSWEDSGMPGQNTGDTAQWPH